MLLCPVLLACSCLGVREMVVVALMGLCRLRKQPLLAKMKRVSCSFMLLYVHVLLTHKVNIPAFVCFELMKVDAHMY